MESFRFGIGFLVDSGVTPASAVIAGLAFLNTLGIFGLIYHAGQLVGKNEERWKVTETRLGDLDAALSSLHSQEVMQAKLDAAVSSVTVALNEVKAEVKSLRGRSHQLSNIMTRFVLDPRANLGNEVQQLDNGNET